MTPAENAETTFFKLMSSCCPASIQHGNLLKWKFVLFYASVLQSSALSWHQVIHRGNTLVALPRAKCRWTWIAFHSKINQAISLGTLVVQWRNTAVLNESIAGVQRVMQRGKEDILITTMLFIHLFDFCPEGVDILYEWVSVNRWCDLHSGILDWAKCTMGQE